MSLVLIPDGPGTTIDLRDGLQGLPVAPRGTGAFVGQFSSGPVTEAALSLTPSLSRLVVGEPDDDFLASLVLDDFYSEFSAPALLGRVTDGNEITSFSDLWDRKPDRSYIRSEATILDRAPLAQAEANNGGRWAGAKFVLSGKVTTIATDLTPTTLDLATSPEYPTAGLFVDQVKGATLILEGDTGFEYEILSNDAAGVVTIKGEFSQAAQDADGTGAITGDWRLTVPHGKELAVVIGQDSRTAARFSLSALRKFTSIADWEQVALYDDLALSADDDRPWVTVISEGEETTYQIAINTTFTGATVEDKLPANYCEIPLVGTVVTGPTLTFQWWRWSANSGNTGDPWLDTIAPVDTALIEPHDLTITFTAATTFDVVATWPDGTIQAIGSGTTATPFVPISQYLTTFTIQAGTVAAVLGDILTIRVNTLPHDLSKRTAFLYPVAVSLDGDTNQRLRIASNDYRSVTVRSDLVLSTFGAVVGTGATFTAAIDLTAVSLVVGDTIIISPDGGAAVTLTSAGSGPGAAAIAVELNALDTENIFLFAASGTFLQVTIVGSSGSKSSLGWGAGTGHATVGFPVTGSDVGVDGVPVRIEARWPMWGGYDGVAPADARYILALDLSDHIFKRWLSTNLGGVRVTTPGVTGSGVKGAVEEFVRTQGWMSYAEFLASLEAAALPGEAALADMQANEVESDFVLHYFPSRAKYLNVDATKTVTRSVSGHLMGRVAFLANIGTDGEKGLQIAVANNNEQGRLSPRVKGLGDDIGRWTPPIKLLNDHGIVPLLWEGASVFAFGNRMFSLGRTPKGRRFTITERAVNYHIARDLFTTTRPIIFKTISSRRLGEIQAQLRGKMRPFFEDGWFSDDGGTLTGFDQQVSVQVPPSENPPENLIEGMVTATIQFRPRPSLEDLKIIISPTQTTSEG